MEGQVLYGLIWIKLLKSMHTFLKRGKLIFKRKLPYTFRYISIPCNMGGNVQECILMIN